MSIRMVAVELYRVMKEIGELEKKLESLNARSHRRSDVKNPVERSQSFEMDRLKKYD